MKSNYKTIANESPLVARENLNITTDNLVQQNINSVANIELIKKQETIQTLKREGFNDKDANEYYQIAKEMADSGLEEV